MRRLASTISALTLTCAAAIAAPPGVGLDPVVVDHTSQQMRDRLAATLVRYAREVFGTQPLSVEGLVSGTAFLVDATVLNPDLLEGWRLLLDAALLTERADLAERSLKAMLRLAPEDSAARLDRLWISLESAPTLEAKADLVERILAPANIDVVGAPVASQLAFRLGLLYRRAGDPNLFWTWLQRALALDPVNQEAVAMQAGVLHRAEQEEPAVWTELLLEIYRANPADTAVAAELGLYLLDHGAYAAAARMLTIVRNMEGAEGGDPGSDLDADIALARWGAGDIAGASDVLERRQRQLNELYQKASAGSPGGSRSSTIEVSSLIAPLPPKVAAVRLLLTDGTDDPTAVADASGELTRSVNHLDGLREEAGVDAVARLGSLKRLLWLLMAMQASPGAIEDVAARIGRIEPLDETSQAIYNAAALATTSPVEAAAALQPFTGESSIAGVLLAQTMSSQGLNREAGHELLKVWQREPGSILGVLAGHRLGQMLGVQLPMGEQAAAMSEVVETLPGVYDRMAGEPSLAITMHVSGPSEVVPVFGPIVLEFEIANHLPDPLPISPSGPVRDLLLIQADADVPYADMKPGPPIMLDVATGLQLPGHGEVKASIDLRSTWVGAAVMGRPLHGASISAEAILNPRFSLGQTSQAPAAQPGMLGGKFASSEIRVDGQRVTDAWISQALDRIRRGTSTAATDAALLAQVLAEQDAPEGGIELDQNRAAEILAAIIELWPQLGPVSQAWLVTTFPRGDRLTRLWTLVESSTDPLIRRTLLMRILSQFGDPAKALDEPAVGESLVSDDLQIRQLAEWIEVTLQLQAERQFGSGRESGGS